MKITLLHYSYLPVVGGVERIVAEHAHLFRQEGHEVMVLCGTIGGAVAPPGVQVLPELQSQPDGRWSDDVEPLAALLEAHLAMQDVVCLHNVCTMPFHPVLTRALWLLASRLLKTRFLAWTHDLAAADPAYTEHFGHEGEQNLLRRACPHFQYVAISALRQEQLANYLGLPRAQVPVVPNGLDVWAHYGVPDPWPRVLSRGHVLERDTILLTPARLLARKNLAGALHILAEVRRQRDAVLLLTAAAEPHRKDDAAYVTGLLALRSELGLEQHALFLGMEQPLTDAAVRGLYRLADGVLLPSQREGFGLPVLEAALHRVPCFYPAQAPMKGLLEHGTGGAYPAYATPEEISNIIVRQIEGSDAIQAHREVRRIYAWPCIYRNYIAPLLQTAQPTAHTHEVDLG